MWDFKPYGQCGKMLGETVAELGAHVDDIAFIHNVTSRSGVHSTATMLASTGFQLPGFPGAGCWVSYGLGSENQDLPGFVALLSGGSDPTGGKACWGSGFLPGAYQGVQCRSVGDPILFTSNPTGMSRETRRRTLDALNAINQEESRLFGDQETVTRIAQYELAYRMQASVPEAFDIKKEPQHIQDLYGAQPGVASFANNCLLARRLVEKGVRFVQVFDWGWDMHGTGEGNDLLTGLPNKCRQTEKAWSALIQDLKQRGMLDDVLVIWGGEFGRTPMNEARGGSPYLGRDHHPHCFTMWMAGGGIKPGIQYGATDEIGYRPAEQKVTLRDLQATLLHQLGLDPYLLSYKFQGLNNRLIGPSNEGRILRDLLA
ncbi:MAG: hypothetical protein RL354_2632 [Planctomycetota bacterium]